MKKLFAMLFGAAITLSTSTTFASDFYGVTQTSYTNWKINNVNVNDTIGVGFGVGLNVTSKIAIEMTYDYLGQGNISGFDQDISSDTVTLWAITDPIIAHVKKMPLRAIARVGIAYTTVSIDFGETETSFNDQALAYGFGGSLKISSHSDIVIDYQHRSSDAFNVDLDSIYVTLKHSF